MRKQKTPVKLSSELLFDVKCTAPDLTYDEAFKVSWGYYKRRLYNKNTKK